MHDEKVKGVIVRNVDVKISQIEILYGKIYITFVHNYNLHETLCYQPHDELNIKMRVFKR